MLAPPVIAAKEIFTQSSTWLLFGDDIKPYVRSVKNGDTYYQPSSSN